MADDSAKHKPSKLNLILRYITGGFTVVLFFVGYANGHSADTDNRLLAGVLIGSFYALPTFALFLALLVKRIV